MENKSIYKGGILDDFIHLSRPLSESEYNNLEYSILCKNYRQTVPVWHNMVLDCFDYYEICKKNGIDVDTKRKKFRTKNDAIIWICRTNLSKQDITKTYKNYLIGVLYSAELKNIRRENAETGEVTKTTLALSAEIGSEFNIGLRMSPSYVPYAKAIKRVYKKNIDFAKMILLETAFVSHPVLESVSSLEEEDITRIVETIRDYDVTCRVQYKPGKSSAGESKISIRPETKTRSTNVTLPVHSVKDFPKPDPDAEISSLTLTIPSWTSSIRRKCNASNFDEVSSEAKERLKAELFLLQDEISITLQAVMEDNRYDFY